MKKQSPDYSSLARLTVVQHLRSYGIKIKHWNCRLRPEPERGSAGPQGDGKVFGTPLHMLPQRFVPDYGKIPKFLVDVCKYLEQHVHTEGLFRKSGSVVRLKLLKARLDSNEDCLSDAPPCDVAGILKQFFRELPEPILHTDLHDALFKAQHLGSDDERTFATMLISCLLPDSTIHTLQYFLRFLHAVSMRSDSNRMDSSNLALIFAPNLLQSNEDSEKISASTEKKLRVQAAVVRTLIDQAAAFGVVPDFLLEKIPGMLGVDEDTGPARTEDGEGDSPGERKRRRRRSVGDFVSGALNKFKTNRTPSSTPQTERTVFGSMVTPLILTPSTKRKLPLDSVQGVSSKKRRAFKHNLMFDRIPGGLFGSTPASASCTGSPCFSLETSQSSLSPSVSSGNPLSSSGNRRKSKRYDSRKVQRVESGKTGCFSPRITRKEMVRRSLRLRFSLGKSNKDLNILNVFPSTTRSENIGLRLANSQEMNSVSEIKVDLGSSPIESPFVSAGLKKICKSEEYLLTPKQSDGSSHCISWTGPCTLELDRPYDEGTPLSGYQCATNCLSEPFLVTGKPPAMPQRSILGYCKQSENPKNDSLCEEEENRAQYTAMRITKAFTESGSDLHKVVGGGKPLQQNASKPLAESILETEAITQVSLKEANERFDNPTEDKCISRVPGKEAIVETSTEGCLLEPSIKDPVIDRQTGSLQMITKDKADNTVDLSNTNPSMQVCTTDVRVNVCNSGVIRSMSTSCPSIGDVYSDDHIQIQQSLSQESFLFPGPDQDLALESSSRKPSSRPRRSSRVSEQIHHFNKLSLNDCSSGQKLKSPLKFQRTPVRQSVRRINSLSGVKKPASSREGTAVKTGVPVAKSLSYDGSLPSDHVLRHSSHPPFSKPNHHVSASHKHLAVAAHSETIGRIPKQPLGNRCCNTENTSNSLKSVLEDLTNRDMQETICKKYSLSASAPNVSSVERVSRRERIRYRGSPRNPITSVTLLPSTKPLEL